MKFTPLISTKNTAAVTQVGMPGHQNWMNLPAAVSSSMPTSTYSATQFQPARKPAKRPR